MSGALRLCHVIHALEFGGMENGLVNLVNRLPEARYCHDIVCLTGAGQFADRLQADNFTIHALNKRSGRDLAVYAKLYRLLRMLRPDIVHTRNLPTCDLPWLARAAGAKSVVHSEHGLDMLELSGRVQRYVYLRRLNRPAVARYIALGNDLRDWLIGTVGAAPERVEVIYNGVDPDAFRTPDAAARAAILADILGEAPPGKALIVGTVGRLSAIKRQGDLVTAAALLLDRMPDLRDRLRVVLVGDGPERESLQDRIARCGLGGSVVITGYRNDVARLLPAMDIFVLPSFREGISNTLLEAMAAGTAIVATETGGNPELVEDGRSGLLVPVADPEALAASLRHLLGSPGQRATLGAAARRRAVERFSLGAMVENYDRVYQATASASASRKVA